MLEVWGWCPCALACFFVGIVTAAVVAALEASIRARMFVRPQADREAHSREGSPRLSPSGRWRSLSAGTAGMRARARAELMRRTRDHRLRLAPQRSRPAGSASVPPSFGSQQLHGSFSLVLFPLSPKCRGRGRAMRKSEVRWYKAGRGDTDDACEKEAPEANEARRWAVVGA